jgi:hypothetical protein
MADRLADPTICDTSDDTETAKKYCVFRMRLSRVKLLKVTFL